jgi:hypothetical protein
LYDNNNNTNKRNTESTKGLRDERANSSEPFTSPIVSEQNIEFQRRELRGDEKKREGLEGSITDEKEEAGIMYTTEKEDEFF